MRGRYSGKNVNFAGKDIDLEDIALNTPKDFRGEKCPAPEDRSYRFGKGERLRHRTLVAGLFAGGRGEFAFPLRAVWRLSDRREIEDSFRNGIPGGVDLLQMMVTVPKKKLKRAVDRVRMRRLIRESYRLNRHSLKDAVGALEGEKYLEVAFIYCHNELCGFEKVERKMIKLLDRIQSQLRASGEELGELHAKTGGYSEE